MKLRDLLASDLLPEMAYTPKKAERIITALEKPINDHLLKLWTDPRAADRGIWIKDLVDWMEEVTEIVLRPANTRPRHVFYYKLLFFEPFGGGAEISNILRRLRRLQRRGFLVQLDITVDALLKRLRAFHRDFSSLCAVKVISEAEIRRFLMDH